MIHCPFVMRNMFDDRAECTVKEPSLECKDPEEGCELYLCMTLRMKPGCNKKCGYDNCGMKELI